MATTHEKPDEVNENLLETLGKEVEMKTFKTNVPAELSKIGHEVVKIICVGDYTGAAETNSVFMYDYLQVRPPMQRPRPYFQTKLIRWKKSDEHEPVTVTLYLWQMAEHALYLTRIARIFFKGAHGALVFWGPQRPYSMDVVAKWMAKIREVCPSIPCVLITDNSAMEPLQWIGPGKIFESELALDQFCKHHGFVGHFEIIARDWESGEKSVFGQGVNCLLENIFY